MSGSEVQQVGQKTPAHPMAPAGDEVHLAVSYAAADRDWAEWVGGHLVELGYRFRLPESPLEPGPAALDAVAQQRRSGTPLVLVASGALLGQALDLLEGDLLDLDRVEPDLAPLVVALIEDVALPAEWGDAVRAPMFTVPDDYTGSRQLLIEALARALPTPGATDRAATDRGRAEPVGTDRTCAEPAGTTWKTPEPLPSVFDRPAAAPAPANPSDATDSDLPEPASHPRAGLIGPGTATSPRIADPVARLEDLARRAAATYGADEVRTLAARIELAQALSAAGSRPQAGCLLEAVLHDSTSRYGEDDPTTTAAKQHLANHYAELGRHDAALELRRQVFDSRAAALGPQHPRTVSAQNNLANSLASLGRVEEALALREAAAEARLRAFGLNDPATLSALNNLAISYAELGRGEDALLLREAVVRGRERLLGPDDPQTIAARNNLANSLAVLGRHDEARQVRAQTLADCERVLGPDHPYSRTARASLAVTPTPVNAASVRNDQPDAGHVPPGIGTDLVSTDEDLVAAPRRDEAGAAAAEVLPRADAGGRKPRFWFSFRRR